MILPANDGDLPPDVTKSPPKVIVGIEQGLAPLVDQINVSKLMEFHHFCTFCIVFIPVQVIYHCLQFLKLLDTKFVLIKEPHSSCNNTRLLIFFKQIYILFLFKSPSIPPFIRMYKYVF